MEKDIKIDYKNLIINMPLSLHSRFKKYCIDKKISMRDAIIELIKGRLNE